MKNILVIGGGFAGVWSALGAVRTAREQGVDASELRVTLVAPTDDLVIRPRLYEADPQAMRVPLDRVLGPVGIHRIAATVTGIDADARQVTAIGRDTRTLDLAYDRLVLATGSQVVRPQLPGSEWLFDIDTLPAAARLDHHLQRLGERAAFEGQFTAVVVGAGFTGLEIATELAGRLRELAPAGRRDEVRVAMVERAEVVGPELGEGPRPHITQVLDDLGVEQLLRTTVDAVTEDSVALSSGETLPSATVIWTAGTTASPLTGLLPGERDRLGRLVVDEYLRVKGSPGIWAAGDTAAAEAEAGHRVTQSCQHAVPLGKFAGRNVAGDLLGLDLVPFDPDPYVTCLDLGPAGAVVTAGWDRAVQMTGEDAKKMKQQINSEWIYPPVDDAALILHRADHRTTWPTSDVSA
ncbi:NAD(P)/FAD-dependent oxidoreductase [Streptomyces sp. NPDC057287]|uniref:NAD(P)/FAD-dependent oxidoreductase n=1 Tax=Streptomyces sp. NPDC057287 TaxID=3346086 RepID=UPI0036311CAF